MSLDARARTSAPFACDTTVWTYKRTPFRRVTRRIGTCPTTAQSPVLQRCGRCLPPPENRFCRPHVLSVPPSCALVFSSGHESKEIMLQEDTPAGGNRSLPCLSIALGCQGRPTPLGVAGPCPCRLQNTQNMQNTKSYSRATSRANGREVRNTRDIQGRHKVKTKNPGHEEHQSQPPKSGSSLENLKLEKAA